ncbi:hypothetical protein NKG99_24205 [Mesorhizobium sp. M1409]|uniref:hypothetical protein n=1 Tax=unclassified Mesorhizobium TaxID=325217 RepID=UPI00333BB06D
MSATIAFGSRPGLAFTVSAGLVLALAWWPLKPASAISYGRQSLMGQSILGRTPIYQIEKPLH